MTSGTGVDRRSSREAAGLRGRRVRAVVNTASGSVSPQAPQQLEQALREAGAEVELEACGPADLAETLATAVAAKPEILVVLAGDGTIREVAQSCGPNGPILMPLAGGTMNVLPFALYGRRPWAEGLAAAAIDGEVAQVSGGEIGGRSFYVAAILGSPALWATAREALRSGRLSLAWLHAQRALKRAFTGRLRLSFDDAPTRKVEALTLMCPLISRGLERDDALEACLLDVRGAVDAFRLGARAALGDAVGGWRADPSVDTFPCMNGKAWARGRIPALLDGEPHRFDPDVAFTFVPLAFRALVPRDRGQPA